MEGTELISFEIISNVGAAKSCYMEAIQCAKTGDIEGARNKIDQGDKQFTEGHHAHFKLVQEEASGSKVEASLLLMHAEDQMMSTETLKLMALEFIDLYEKQFALA